MDKSEEGQYIQITKKQKEKLLKLSVEKSEFNDLLTVGRVNLENPTIKDDESLNSSNNVTIYSRIQDDI